MDLIRDIKRTASTLRHGAFSLFRWLDIPNDSIVGRMPDNFGSGKRHFSFFPGKCRSVSLGCLIYLRIDSSSRLKHEDKAS